MTPRLPSLAPLAALAALACLGAAMPAPAQSAGPKPAQASAPAPGAAPVRPWAQFLDDTIEAQLRSAPSRAVGLGRHEFDGQLPDWSAQGVSATVRQLHAQRAAAEAYDPATLDATGRFDREVLLAQLDRMLFELETLRLPATNPHFYLGALDPEVYLTRPYAPLPVRMRAYIAYLGEIPRAAQQIQAQLELPLPRSFNALGQRSFRGYASFYRDEAPAVFAAVKDPALQAQLRAATEPAALAMQALASRLEKDAPHSTGNFALGRARFTQMLWAGERVTMPLEEIEARGRADLERNLTALAKACAEFAPGASVHECTLRAANHKSPQGPVKAARELLASLRQFILDQDLLTIPGEEQAQVDEAPAYQRWNQAYINITGPYDRGLPSTYYIAPPDPAWTAAEQREYLLGEGGLLYTTVHEVWPGHFLQYLHANRSRYVTGRLFESYSYSEGWAHYSEELMYEAGLRRGSAEMHIGQLTEALLRNVRLVCAIGLHTQGMGLEQCEQLFRDKGQVDPANARQQAERGTFDPGYLVYTMGKLMIRDLRERWTATRGGRAAWKAFHDQFLSYGTVPIPLVADDMLKDGNTKP